MTGCRCHANSGIFWSNYSTEHGTDAVKIVTGWALIDDDGVWVQHSWLQLKDRNNLIVETTIKRDKYFGFVLTDVEAIEFCDNNQLY